jgi:hypothetical protein
MNICLFHANNLIEVLPYRIFHLRIMKIYNFKILLRVLRVSPEKKEMSWFFHNLAYNRSAIAKKDNFFAGSTAIKSKRVFPNSIIKRSLVMLATLFKSISEMKQIGC